MNSFVILVSKGKKIFPSWNLTDGKFSLHGETNEKSYDINNRSKLTDLIDIDLACVSDKQFEWIYNLINCLEEFKPVHIND